ncbi:MAG: ABC transporter substrate-binding protein [Candidatus Rokubacteria bacterium]|nr:ABC transporter substrate-binding protein [Candidatus Rokubacteria bacterium]
MPRSITILVTLALAVLGAPLASDAQRPPKVHRIGFLGAASSSGYASLVEAFRQGLRDLGYVEGKNIVIEYRWAEGRYDSLPDLAAELVRLNVEVIVTHGTPGTLAAKQATKTIPIVMAVSGDAVATGIVASVARPGGNITGSTFFFPEINAKRLELLKEAVPRASRVALLLNPDNPSMGPVLKAVEAAARSLKVQLHQFEVRSPDEFAGAFSAMTKRRAEAVAIIDDAVLIAHAGRIADLAVKSRLPTIGFREYADVGGLMAYAVNFPDIWRRAAVFVDKLLKGAKPADLPIEQATKFELIINLKTAKALGLTMPQSLLIRAEHVIQ